MNPKSKNPKRHFATTSHNAEEGRVYSPRFGRLFSPAPARCLLTMAMLFCAVAAFGQQLTWDPNGNGGATSASGNWDTSTANWFGTALPDEIWEQTSGTTATAGAIFGGGDGSYQITNVVQIAYTNLTINNSGYTFNSNELYAYSAAAYPTVVVAAGKTVTFNCELTGAANAPEFFEGGSNSVINILGGAVNGQQPEFETLGTLMNAGTGATFYFSGTFAYNVTYVCANCIQTNGSYKPNGFFCGRPQNGDTGSLAGASNGTWTVTGSNTTFTMSGANLIVARGGATGTFTVANGATASTAVSTSSGQNDYLVLCNDNSSDRATVIVSGGTLNVGTSASTAGGILEMLPAGSGANSWAVFNQTGGTVNAWGGILIGDTSSGVAYNATTFANFTNSGGFLYIGSVGGNGGGINVGASVPPTINVVFTGGTIGTLGTWSSPLPITLSSLNGNPTFQCANSNGSSFNISLSGALTGAGGLYKTGGGTLTLSGANTYAGSTVVSNGELSVATLPSPSTGSVIVDGSSGSPTLSMNSTAGDSWTVTGLTFRNGTPTADFQFDGVPPSTSVAPIQVNGNVVFTATPNVTVEGTGIVNGTYPLIHCSGGTISGTMGSVTITGSAGAVGTIQVVGNTVNLVVTGSTLNPSLYWETGAGSWNFSATTDWKQLGNFVVFANNDLVTLDNTAPGPFPIAITLNTVVQPASLTANNTSGHQYTISGTGSIAGSTGVSVLGGGTLALGNTNTYTGGTMLTSGQLDINNGGDNTGNDSAIGTGPLTINGGTAIDNTSGAAVTLVPSISENWNGNFTYVGSSNLNTGPGSVTMNGSVVLTISSNTLIVPGSISDQGNNYILSKAGNGTLTLLNGNGFGGGFVLENGLVNIGNPSALGSGVFTVSGGSMDNVSGGTLDLMPSSMVWAGTVTYVGSTPNILDIQANVAAANNAPPLFVDVVSNTFETDGDLGVGNNVVTKTGAGTWIIGGFADSGNQIQAVVAAGTVVLARESGTAIANRPGSGLTVESNALVLDNGNGVEQIGNGEGVPILLQSGGILDLYGNSETVDSLTNNGGVLQNGAAGSSATLTITYVKLPNFPGAVTLDSSTSNQMNVASNATLTIDAPLIGPGGLSMNGWTNPSTGGVLNLEDSNTYSGETTIGSGTLALQGSASISDTAGIFLADTNSVLDLSQIYPSQLALVNGQTLSGFGTVNCPSGNVTTATGAIVSPGSASAVGTLTVAGNVALGTDGTGTTVMELDPAAAANDVLSVSGSLVLGGTLSLPTLAGTLATGQSYTLFNAGGGISGSFASITPATPGPGLTWNTGNLTVNGSISISGSGLGPARPRLTGIQLTGTTLTIEGTNGVDGGQYVLLKSTNVATPLADWIPVGTNNFNGSGNFSTNITVPHNTPAEFYIISQP